MGGHKQTLLKHLETHPGLHINDMQSFLVEKCHISAGHTTIRRKLKEAGWTNTNPRGRGGTWTRDGAGSAGQVHRDSPASSSSISRRARHPPTSNRGPPTMAERNAEAEALVPRFKFERLLNQGTHIKKLTLEKWT